MVLDPFDIIESRFKDTVPSKVSSFVLVQVESTEDSDQFLEKLRLLLVEDTPFFRKTIQKYLQRYGYQVDVVVDGQDGIDKLNQEDVPYDLIISDVEMPRMNGFGFGEIICHS